MQPGPCTDVVVSRCDFLKKFRGAAQFLIVGWATLAAAEISALFGQGAYGRSVSWGWILCIVILAVISLICYLLYYNLDSVKGYYDGMIPLIIVAAVTAVMSVTMT